MGQFATPGVRLTFKQNVCERRPVRRNESERRACCEECENGVEAIKQDVTVEKKKNLPR